VIGEIVRCGFCGATHPFDAEICDECSRPLDDPLETSSFTQISMHPAVRFRFADVLAELRCIAAMAAVDVAIDPGKVGQACHRAEPLLLLLRRQFLDDVVFAEDAPSTRLPA
jgi:hypothetical protein